MSVEGGCVSVRAVFEGCGRFGFLSLQAWSNWVYTV